MSGLTPFSPASARDTVLIETPHRAAISSRRVRLPFFSSAAMSFSSLPFLYAKIFQIAQTECLCTIAQEESATSGRAGRL
jgi:hypothetical protein